MPPFSRRKPFALIAELAERGGGLRRVFQPLDAPETDIGRGVPRPGAGSLQLPQLWVSRCHATIRRSEDNRFYLHVHGRAGCDVARHGSSQHLGCADAPWLLSPQDEIFVCGGPASDRVRLHFVESFSNDDAATWWCEKLKSNLPCVVESQAKPDGSYAVAAQLPQRVWHGDLESLEDLNRHADEAGQETQCEPDSPEQSCLSTRRRCALMGGASGQKDVRLFVALDAAWTDIGRGACPGPSVLQLTQVWVSRQHARIRRVEDENGATYSVLVESKLGIDVSRNGQQHHLPKASPPWQLLLGDVLTFRGPPSVTLPQKSIELRFVDVFSRADAATFRGGDSLSVTFPCVVDSGPWPDGTYDVRIRAEAWHGHLTARAAEIAEEEPMTQLQDAELAETQGVDDFGGSPVRVPSLFSMLPPPLPPPRAARDADGAGAGLDALAADPMKCAGDLAGHDMLHDGAEGSGVKRLHPVGSEVDVSAKDECPKKAARLSTPSSSSGATHGTSVGVIEGSIHFTAEQESKRVPEKAPDAAKRHRKDEGADELSHKSARCDTDTVFAANGTVKACGVPPAKDEVQTCVEPAAPVSPFQSKSENVTDADKSTGASVESAEGCCLASAGRNVVPLEADIRKVEVQQPQKRAPAPDLGQSEGSLRADLLVERVAHLSAQSEAKSSVTSSETLSETVVEPVAKVAMQPSSQAISQPCSQLRVQATEQPIEKLIEQPTEKLGKQPALMRPSTQLPAQPRIELLAQPTAVQPHVDDVTSAVEAERKEPSALLFKVESQATPQRSSAGTIASPSSSEKMLAPAFRTEGTDACLHLSRAVGEAALKANDCESKDRRVHNEQPKEVLFCAGMHNDLQVQSANKESERSLVELPVGPSTEPVAEPSAKSGVEPLARYISKPVAEPAAKPDAKSSVDLSVLREEHAAAQQCALTGLNPFSSSLSRQSAQLFMQPLKQPSVQSSTQPSTQCLAQPIFPKLLAQPLSNQLASQAGSADGHSLKNSETVALGAVRDEKKRARSQPRQDTPVKDLLTQELPTQVVPTQEVPSPEVEASAVGAPDVSPTQLDGATARASLVGAISALPSADVSCTPSKELKSIVPKANTCNKDDQPSHEATPAACASEELKARDVKASQTEGKFRRTDTCITQEVTASVEASVDSTVELPVEPPQNQDVESEVEEDVEVVEESAGLLESQAVWSASDCE